MTEREAIIELCKALNEYDAAAAKFIAKVENGQARSRETYTEFRAARARSLMAVDIVMNDCAAFASASEPGAAPALQRGGGPDDTREARGSGMNERAVEVLVGAALRGVPQIKRAFAKGDGRCALGALGWENDKPNAWHDDIIARYGMAMDDHQPCPHACGFAGTEPQIIGHMNDLHGDDFLTIARKLGPDSA